MASSKLKKPPSLHQKRTPKDPATPESDQAVLTAFKKLKVDAEGGYVQKIENQSKTSLKHKFDSTPTELQVDQRDEAKDAEDWSRSLQNFCFCDEGAFNKRGRSKWKSMCHFHRLLMRKDSTSHRNSLNLAHAVRAHKPLLQESRLKPAKKANPSQVMRSARFSFDMKAVKESEEKKSRSVLVPVKSTATTLVGSSKSPLLSDKASQESSVTSQTVFGAGASEIQLNFSSLLLDEEDSAPKNRPEPVPSFDGYRGGCVSHGRGDGRSLMLWPQENSSESCRSSVVAPTPSSGAAVPRRVDLAVERSCSQEARLDESEYSVTELAAYFDHYLHMPKEMSSMAKMMYT